MNILYVSQFFYPEITAGAFRVYETCKLWSENNNVTVVTTYPNYPKGKIYKGYKNHLFSKEEVDGVNVYRIKSIIRANTNKINRIILYLSFLISAFLNTFIGNIQMKDYDVVVGTSGPVFAPLFAYYMAKKNKIPFVLELRDITFIQMLGTFSSKNSMYFKMIKALEMYLCKRADHIVVTTKSFKEILIEEGMDENEIDVVENGILINNINHEERSKDNILKFCYAGTVGISQDIKGMIDFFEEMKIENKEVYIIGHGAEWESIENYIKDKEISYIKLLGSMDKSKVEEYYQICDMGIVKLKDSNEFANFIPSKLFHIMANKRPVLYLGPKGEVTDMIQNNDLGLHFKNGLELEKYIKKFESIEELKNSLEQMGNNAREYTIENYDREELTAQYMNTLKKVVTRKAEDKGEYSKASI
ncbi:glycosyltransferase family 4 protein [Anaeromicrobium sediminis]|uniref:Glycosyltransferase WbuB n=1 Tax=Anaeromicrobium sediminis TaxID=1478221 RepID=A0A267MHB9_9FIRM|nr:glycosyltransferase family 4 protein [Anaeromicrobium sediminis]PAB58275.1 hypothetical protein CCE28_15885 [Anaeromicrobium sediminis]